MTVSHTKRSTSWIHTGIDAPYLLRATAVSEVEHDRGVAYSAELVHPELGIVGTISNRGCGDATRFDAHDDDTFSSRDLEQFLQQCLHDGEPIGADDLELLLDEIIDETETAEHVAEARRAGLFLVRAYRPRTSGGHPYRGYPLRWTRIALSRAAREALAARLDATPGSSVHGTKAYWQMFNGEAWTPLLAASPLTPEQIGDRVRRASRFTGRSMQGEPFDGQFRIHGNPAGKFALIGDSTAALNASSWCRCTRPSKRTVRFERWNYHVLQYSGVIHAAKTCRRLVRID